MASESLASVVTGGDLARAQGTALKVLTEWLGLEPSRQKGSFDESGTGKRLMADLSAYFRAFCASSPPQTQHLDAQLLSQTFLAVQVGFELSLEQRSAYPSLCRLVTAAVKAISAYFSQSQLWKGQESETQALLLCTCLEGLCTVDSSLAALERACFVFVPEDAAKEERKFSRLAIINLLWRQGIIAILPHLNTFTHSKTQAGTGQPDQFQKQIELIFRAIARHVFAGTSDFSKSTKALETLLVTVSTTRIPQSSLKDNFSREFGTLKKRVKFLRFFLQQLKSFASNVGFEKALRLRVSSSFLKTHSASSVPASQFGLCELVRECQTVALPSPECFGVTLQYIDFETSQISPSAIGCLGQQDLPVLLQSYLQQTDLVRKGAVAILSTILACVPCLSACSETVLVQSLENMTGLLLPVENQTEPRCAVAIVDTALCFLSIATGKHFHWCRFVADRSLDTIKTFLPACGGYLFQQTVASSRTSLLTRAVEVTFSYFLRELTSGASTSLEKTPGSLGKVKAIALSVQAVEDFLIANALACRTENARFATQLLSLIVGCECLGTPLSLHLLKVLFGLAKSGHCDARLTQVLVQLLTNALPCASSTVQRQLLLHIAPPHSLQPTLGNTCRAQAPWSCGSVTTETFTQFSFLARVPWDSLTEPALKECVPVVGRELLALVSLSLDRLDQTRRLFDIEGVMVLRIAANLFGSGVGVLHHLPLKLRPKVTMQVARLFKHAATWQTTPDQRSCPAVATIMLAIGGRNCLGLAELSTHLETVLTCCKEHPPLAGLVALLVGSLGSVSIPPNTHADTIHIYCDRIKALFLYLFSLCRGGDGVSTSQHWALLVLVLEAFRDFAADAPKETFSHVREFFPPDMKEKVVTFVRTDSAQQAGHGSGLPSHIVTLQQRSAVHQTFADLKIREGGADAQRKRHRSLEKKVAAAVAVKRNRKSREVERSSAALSLDNSGASAIEVSLKQFLARLAVYRANSAIKTLDGQEAPALSLSGNADMQQRARKLVAELQREFGV